MRLPGRNRPGCASQAFNARGVHTKSAFRIAAEYSNPLYDPTSRPKKPCNAGPIILGPPALRLWQALQICACCSPRLRFAPANGSVSRYSSAVSTTCSPKVVADGSGTVPDSGPVSSVFLPHPATIVTDVTNAATANSLKLSLNANPQCQCQYQI